MDYSSKEYFDKMTAWWRAANYLSVGQIYLKDNPLTETYVETRRCQKTSNRSLGNDSWPKFYLCPFEPSHQ
ncbi:hypothetical protein I8F94_10605 [Enterococcus gallinarum]|nr:hypothetical protein [Enterococcus gallinarum]